MRKLKKKIFNVILIILTIFLLSILVIFNYQDYKQEVSQVKDTLMRMDNNQTNNSNMGIPPEKI